jgi:hypothetical protein
MNIKIDIKRKVIINGKEYKSIEQIPHDIPGAREIFRNLIDPNKEVLEAAESGAPPSDANIAGISSGMGGKPVTNSSAPPGETRKPPREKPSFFLPTLLMSTGLLALFLLIHYLLQDR